MKTWHFTARWLLGSQFVARVLGLLNNILLARLLAPPSFGDFTQAMAYAGSLASLADTGVSAVVTRHVARRPRSVAVVGAATGLRIVQGVLLWSTAALIAWFMGRGLTLGLSIVLAGAYWSLACAQQLLAGIARARTQAHIEAQAVAIERVTTVLLAAMGAALFGVLGALMGVLVGGALALFHLLRRLSLARARADWRIWKRLFVIGAPLAIADVCHGLIMRLDLLAIAMRYGSQSAGWYGSASTLLWASLLVPGSMALALVPALASARGAIPVLDRRVLVWMLAVAAVMAVVLSGGSGLWVKLLYGENYAPAAGILSVLAWCLVPGAVVAWGNALLIVQHRTAWVGAVAFMGLTCLVLCLWWWLPEQGVVGAARAQMAAQCFMGACAWWLANASGETSPS